MSRYDQNKSNKSNKTIFFIVAILIALSIGMGGSYYFMDEIRYAKEVEVSVSNEVQAKEIAVSDEFPDEELEFLPEYSETLAGNDGQSSIQQNGLPDLLSSDDVLRQALIKISPGLAQWLNTDQLIRKFVVITNDFGQGLRISKHMNFLRFDEPFAVNQDANGLYIASKSFQRYDNLVQSIQAIDAKAAVAFYQQFRPLMLQVFAEFNYPKEIALESIVKKAAGEIIATPAIEGQVALVRPSVYYKFADAELEALSPVQKQMIRMGPENTRIIQGKCREFLVELAKAGVK